MVESQKSGELGVREDRFPLHTPNKMGQKQLVQIPDELRPFHTAVLPILREVRPKQQSESVKYREAAVV